jgi:hypothetical protein
MELLVALAGKAMLALFAACAPALAAISEAVPPAVSTSG